MSQHHSQQLPAVGKQNLFSAATCKCQMPVDTCNICYILFVAAGMQHLSCNNTIVVLNVCCISLTNPTCVVVTLLGCFAGIMLIASRDHCVFRLFLKAAPDALSSLFSRLARPHSTVLSGTALKLIARLNFRMLRQALLQPFCWGLWRPKSNSVFGPIGLDGPCLENFLGGSDDL